MPANLQVVPAASPSPLDMWPITGDAPDIRTIVEDQATTIAAQAVLIDAYQANLNTAQSQPGTATGSGTTTGSSTSVVMTAVTGLIKNGAVVTDGASVPAGTTVLGQISGTTGGAGTYLISVPINLTAATTLTFTGGGTSTWPIPTDADTLMIIQQTQTAILRTQSALISHYQDLLNQSQTPAPPTGP